MAVTVVRQEFDLETRDRHTKVKCEVFIKVDGRELPNGAILGQALDDAIQAASTTVQDSYKVPPRVPTPPESTTSQLSTQLSAPTGV